MAAYQVARSKHATLVAATVDTVTFQTTHPAVEVVNRSTDADIWMPEFRTGTLTIGTRTGSPPFAYINKNNEWIGFSIDLVETAILPRCSTGKRQRSAIHSPTSRRSR